MTDKKEMLKGLIAMGIAPPDNWSKLSTERAKAFHDTVVAQMVKQPAPKRGVAAGLSRAAVSIAAAVTGLAMASAEVVTGPKTSSLDDAARKHAKKKVYSDPSYVRTTRKSRREQAYFKTRVSVPLPEVLTRQLQRQMDRRAGRMPVGMSAARWHNDSGFGKIGSGRKYQGA